MLPQGANAMSGGESKAPSLELADLSGGGEGNGNLGSGSTANNDEVTVHGSHATQGLTRVPHSPLYECPLLTVACALWRVHCGGFVRPLAQLSERFYA